MSGMLISERQNLASVMTKQSRCCSQLSIKYRPSSHQNHARCCCHLELQMIEAQIATRSFTLVCFKTQGRLCHNHADQSCPHLDQHVSIGIRFSMARPASAAAALSAISTTTGSACASLLLQHDVLVDGRVHHLGLGSISRLSHPAAIGLSISIHRPQPADTGPSTLHICSSASAPGPGIQAMLGASCERSLGWDPFWIAT
ncbi:hypothetical protein BC831DRAFT_187066 [Entophlyctis helioformis]|nr:hypothetical protein BC831DRAFT_187066 [Entophlyctis helioformis]